MTGTGTSPIHRLPPAIKLIALFGFSLLLFAVQSPIVLAALAGMVLAATLALCRPALMQWLKAWPLLLTIVIVVVWTAVVTGPGPALVALLRLGSLSLFATVVTTTTSAGQFIETITALALPLERIGIGNARDIGLAIGLVIRFVPDMHARYGAIVDAHRARGLKPSVRTIIAPMLIGTLKSADDIADAIDARSIRADKTQHQ